MYPAARGVMYAAILAVGMGLLSRSHAEDARRGEGANSALKRELADFMESQGYAAVPALVVRDRDAGQQEMRVEASVCGDFECTVRNLQIDTGEDSLSLSRSLIEELELPEAGVPPTDGEAVEYLIPEICVQDRRPGRHARSSATAARGPSPGRCIQNSRAGVFSDPETELLGGLVFRKLGAIIDIENEMIYLPPAEAFPLLSLTDWIRAREPSYESVPLRAIGNHIVVPAQINDSGPQQFLFDTGAISLIDTSYVDSLGLAIQEDDCETSVAQTGVILTCPLRANEVRKMQVDGVRSSFVPDLFATDLSFVLPGIGIRGIVGFDWMLGNKAIIDYESGQIWIDTTD